MTVGPTPIPDSVQSLDINSFVNTQLNFKSPQPVKVDGVAIDISGWTFQMIGNAQVSPGGATGIPSATITGDSQGYIIGNLAFPADAGLLSLALNYVITGTVDGYTTRSVLMTGKLNFKKLV